MEEIPIRIARESSMALIINDQHHDNCGDYSGNDAGGAYTLLYHNPTHTHTHTHAHRTHG